ncbi:hypothetical protein PF008_g25371 [Phytophthora fragariae]|uniref:CASTOR ACT domain-containing protein n=1 Tax=Phytophthora fragariae TaxID=53985 RepID=A0A6G0QKB3_9STRA|nr:hypothetical protein PF008_g25371 [Phytophthora fragariae]
MHFETNYRQVATSSQVQLVCLSTTLVVTSADKCVTPTSTWSDNAPRSALALVPPLLELLFYTPSSLQLHSDHERLRFLSYVETQHEVSLVFEEQLLAKFPQGVLEFEPLRWKALQISTYQTDYVLVKMEDLDAAIGCLQSFCSIEMESEEQLSVVGGGDEPEQDAEQKEEPLEVHQHPLSVPDVKLHLVQLNRTFVRRHLYSLVELLFKPTQLEEERFLSYSETGDDISVVTSDENFLDEARTLMEQGDQGVLVSPDFWRPVQIGNTKLGFAETGIVAGQTRVLVNAGTTVFYLSTYATDFMLIKEDEWDDALPILRDHFRLIEGWGALYIFA